MLVGKRHSLSRLSVFLVVEVLAWSVAWSQQSGAGPAGRGGPDEVISLGETIYVRAPSGLRIKEAATSRHGIVEVRPVKDKPNVLEVTGLNVGSTRLTLTDEKDQVTTFIISVEPDIQFIRQAVAKQFPRANVEITQGPDRTLIVGGSVHAAEDIDPLIRFLEGYAGAGRVVNNLRVVGPHLVQLEVVVAKVDRTELRRFGFNFLWSDRADYFGSTVGTLVNPQSINLRGGVGTFSTDRPIFDANSNLLLGITDASSAFLGFVEALRREGLAKIISSPVVTACSAQPARFVVGGEQPYPTPAALGQPPGVEFRRFGTIVQFLPIVLGDGRIRIKVRAEVSRLDFSNPVQISGTLVPRFLTQEEETTVELESGQSLVLGGLIQTEVDAATNKVPYLGDLPLLGTAFRRVQYEEREQELIILVTPRLVGALWPHQRPACLPGQETRRPTDFELFLEGILEAPPGPRPLRPDGCYRPAHWPLGLPGAQGSDTMGNEERLPPPSLLPRSPAGPPNKTQPSAAPGGLGHPTEFPPVLPPAASGSTGKPSPQDSGPRHTLPSGGNAFPTNISANPHETRRDAVGSARESSSESVYVEAQPNAAPAAVLGTPSRRQSYRPLREEDPPLR
ncbi:MAG: hypothetical protein RMI91_10190 [Gemmatales bacterium]|nr:hypothetical protein [Gemmatales bacterium]MDW7995011.1 hypothetical protein [Gemmatales bacterium]